MEGVARIITVLARLDEFKIRDGDRIVSEEQLRNNSFYRREDVLKSLKGEIYLAPTSAAQLCRFAADSCQRHGMRAVGPPAAQR